MKAYVFPGQGAQFVGMGKDLYENHPVAKELFEQANEILGFRITDIMFAGTDEELKQTKVTQPAVFLHSVISARCLGAEFQPDMVGGHSLRRIVGAHSGRQSSLRRRFAPCGEACHGHASCLRSPPRNNGCHYRTRR